MAAKKGDGLLMVYCDVAAEHDEEFNRWYNEEHIPERLAIPGVLNAARYKAVAGGPTYLACYELASPDAWYAEAWQRWLKNPTAWSKRMAPSVIGTSYIRNLYRRIYPPNVPAETAQAEMSPVLLVGRMSVPAELEAKFNEAYNHERLPLCDGLSASNMNGRQCARHADVHIRGVAWGKCQRTFHVVWQRHEEHGRQ